MVVDLGDSVVVEDRLDHRLDKRLDHRGGDSSVVDHRLDNGGNSGRVDLGHSGNMAVGVHSGDVVVGVDKEGVSLSLSLSLDNVLDRSVLGNVLGANSSVGDSGVVLRVVVVGDGVGGNLGLGIDHRAGNMLNKRGGNRLNHRGGNSLDNRGGNMFDHRGGNRVNQRGGNMVVGGGDGLDSSSVVKVDIVESPKKGGGGVGQSIGFRLSKGGSGQSENYEHLHGEELLL